MKKARQHIVRAFFSFVSDLYDARSVAAFTFELAPAADSLGFFAFALFRRLLVIPAEFHVAENSFALHFLFQNTQSLINVIVANLNTYQTKSPQLSYVLKS